MKNVRLAALALILVQAAPAQPGPPELRYQPPANFHCGANSSPDDYSATYANAGLQVYPFRPFTGDINQPFHGTLLRDWIEPRSREAKVAAATDFRSPRSAAGARHKEG